MAVFAMTTRHSAVLAGLLIVMAACSSTPAPTIYPAARASGSVVKALAGGQLPRLPTGPVYFRFIHFAEPPGHSFKSTQHVPGFVYVERGTHRLQLVDEPAQDFGAGEAAFVPSVTHQHFNSGPDANSWYFIALWPNTARGLALVDPTVSSVAFATPDFESGTLAQGAYSQVLRRVTLDAGGRTAAHSFGGFSVLFVLQGSVTVRAAGSPSATFQAGLGLSHAAGVGLQEINATGSPAVFLELLTTATGKNFETMLNQPPA